MAGLYFHVPFRRARRAFDDAYYVVTDASEFPRYVDSVCQELRLVAQKHADDEAVDTISAGGGRPSLLPLSDVRPILHTVLDVFNASDIKEVTAEVNPADASLHYLNGLRSLGFDRLHFEVLSFFPEDLDALDAPHTADDAVRALRDARQAGFDAVSIDLTFGWPGQPLLHWKANLQQAVRMRVPHVSIVEWTGSGASPPPGNGLNPDASSTSRTGDSRTGDSRTGDSRTGDSGPGDAARSGEIDSARRLRFAMEFLQDEGYEQYELTHFARPGFRSAHLTGYYAHDNYLGVGPSAETFWWPHRLQNAPAQRWTNVKDLDRYTHLLSNRYPPVSYRQTVDWTSLAQEFVFLRLRTHEGLDLRHLKTLYDVDLRSERGALLEKLEANDLVEPLDDGVVRLTLRGRLVADGITQRLMPG